MNIFKLTYDMASTGQLAAMHNVGTYYLRGYGVQPNADEGVRWLSMAAEKGLKDSARLLHQLYERGAYGVQRDEKKALFWKNKYEN